MLSFLSLNTSIQLLNKLSAKSWLRRIKVKENRRVKIGKLKRNIKAEKYDTN